MLLEAKDASEGGRDEQGEPLRVVSYAISVWNIVDFWIAICVKRFRSCEVDIRVRRSSCPFFRIDESFFVTAKFVLQARVCDSITAR